MAEPTVQELQNQLTDLNKKLREAGGLGIDLQEAFRNAGNDTKKLNEYASQLNKQYEDIVDNADYIYRTFQDITAELKNQNLLLKLGKSVFKGFTDIAQDLNSYQKGYNDLSDSKFKKLKNNLGLEKKELEFVISQLKASENSRKREFERLSILEDRTPLQEKRLKELLKENELLINSEEALKSGIPILEKELNLTKQIADTRESLGGITQAVGKTLSQFGGSLAEFLNIGSATEAAEEFNQQLVQKALSNEKVKSKLLENERKKRLAEANRDEKGRFITQEEAQKRLIELEQESYDIKQKVIASTNNLSNKFKSLGVFVKELGVGLKKALTDPITILTFIIGKALEANKQTVELGKSLGYGEKNAYRFRENIAAIARDSTNINVTAASLTEAFNELVQATGFAYEFTADQLETQIKLTKQVGLQADEAAQIQRFGILNNKTSEETYKSFVRGLTVARNQYKVGINFKAALAEAAKVSGQLAANLGFNPEMIAKAVVAAKSFGMTLDQVAKSGEALLNFESSIENELKAELLTGKQLNLERARAAALAGDQITLAEELAKNIGTAADFTKMNVLQQRSLAESVGMTTDELAETLRRREEALASGKSLAQITEEEAQAALERQAIQDKFNAAILKLQDFFGNLLAGPVGQLLDALTQIVGVITDVLQPVLSVVFAPLTWAAGMLGGMTNTLKTIAGIYLAIKGYQAASLVIQKSSLITTRSNYAISALSMGQEAFITREKGVQAIMEKQSLGTRIAYNLQLLAGLVREQGILGVKTFAATLDKDSLARKIIIGTYEAASLIRNKLITGFAAFRAASEKGIIVSLIRQGAVMLVNLGRAIATAVAEITGASAVTLGVAAGIALAAGGAAYAFLSSKKGDDIMSEGGYGKRTLLAPEGAIRLNDKDTVIAGTNLGGGEGNMSMPQIDLTPMITAINEVKAAVDRLYNKDISINMDGKKVGTTLVQGSYKAA